MTSSGWSPLQWEFPRRIDPKQTWCVRKYLPQGWIKAWFKHIYGNVYGPVNPLHRKQYFVLLIRVFQLRVVCYFAVGAVAKYCDQYCLSVCLSVRGDIPGTTRAIITTFFVHVAYVRGSVLLGHVDDRPHHLSLGRGWRGCTSRANCNLRLPC